MSRFRIRWYVPIAIAFLVFMAFNVSRLLHADNPTRPRANDIAAAERLVAPPPGELDERYPPPPAASLSGNGVVEPNTPETRIGTVVPGRIVKVLVTEGQRVAAGDVLLELDAAVEAATLAASEAEVAASAAQLARSVRGSRSEDIRAATADADTAEARAELSQSVADRVSSAAAGGAATGDEADRARRQAQADRAASAAALARQQAVVAGSRREDVQLARAQWAAAIARRDGAKAELDRLTLRAPMAGEVLQLKYRLGEYIQPGDGAVVIMGDTQHLKVRMDVDERDIAKITVGKDVVVRANAFPGIDFTGTVVELGRRMGRKNVRSDDPSERNDTKILEAVIALQGAPGLLVGQRVTCYVTAKTPSK